MRKSWYWDAAHDEMLRLILRHARTGACVTYIPGDYDRMPMPGYTSIRLAVLPARKLAGVVDAFRPDALHVAAEGSLGITPRRPALARGWRFTTSFHTRIPECLHARTRVPVALSCWRRIIESVTDQ